MIGNRKHQLASKIFICLPEFFFPNFFFFFFSTRGRNGGMFFDYRIFCDLNQFKVSGKHSSSCPWTLIKDIFMLDMMNWNFFM